MSTFDKNQDYLVKKQTITTVIVEVEIFQLPLTERKDEKETNFNNIFYERQLA